jgi:hypothetical protein
MQNGTYNISGPEREEDKVRIRERSMIPSFEVLLLFRFSCDVLYGVYGLYWPFRKGGLEGGIKFYTKARILTLTQLTTLTKENSISTTNKTQSIETFPLWKTKTPIP